MFNVKSVDEVFEIIRESFSGYLLEKEEVSLKNALGRITACEFSAREDVPGFNRSQVDGYAVVSSDTFGCSESIPAMLKLVEEVEMGVSPELNWKKDRLHIYLQGESFPKALM